MKKTITLSSDPFEFSDKGVTFDFINSVRIPAPSSFPVKNVMFFTSYDPLAEKAFTSYDTGDGLVLFGDIVLNRVGSVMGGNGSYQGTYTETFNVDASAITAIRPSPFAFESSLAVEFSGAVNYLSIAGKTIGALIEDGDTIIATDKNDKLSMTDKSETVQSGSGNDTVNGRGGNDSIYGGKGSDTLLGGAGNDFLDGAADKDVLKGEAGNDVIYGGTGADKLYGGAGKDTFVFKSTKDSTSATSGQDTIYDFSRSQKDKIDLSAIDANTKVSGNQAFTFIGTGDFHKKPGELRYEKKGTDTFVYGDVNGDGKIDFTIKIDPLLTLGKSDFLL